MLNRNTPGSLPKIDAVPLPVAVDPDHGAAHEFLGLSPAPKFRPRWARDQVWRRLFGVDPQWFMNMQSKYDLRVQAERLADEFAAIQSRTAR